MADKPFVPPTFTEQFERVPPDTLYHYTGQTGLVGIVQKEELWATKIQYMNDATEFGLAIRLISGRSGPRGHPAGARTAGAPTHPAHGHQPRRAQFKLDRCVPH
jgi:hypothetical protein